MTDVKHWLDDLGLSQYARAFVDNSIDLDVLSDLSEQDLKTLGVAPDHCSQLLRAIGALSDGAEILIPHALAPEEADLSPHRCQAAERRQLSVMLVDLIGWT